MDAQAEKNPTATNVSAISGSMAVRIAEMDWSTTPLGARSGWPAALEAAVGICLGSELAMFVWWGPDLIQIYNDAYAFVLGKRHPSSLGRPAREVWAELWPLIGDDVDGVIQRGVPVLKHRVPLILERNGYPEETFFTYSHSPIPDGKGGVAGLFQVCIDETARVRAEQDRDRQTAERIQADDRARAILESITDAFFGLDKDWRFTYVNGQASRLLGRQPRDLIGKNIWEEYPGLRNSPFEPIYRDAHARRVAGSMTDFYRDHERWYEVHAFPAEEGGVSIYFRDVTERRRVEDAAEEVFAKAKRQAHIFDTALTHINDFAYLFDLDGRFLYANKPLLDLWEMTIEQAVGKNFYDLNYAPELAARLQRQIQQVIDTKKGLVDETLYTSPAGVVGYYEYIFTPVFAADGSVEGVVGSTRVITARKVLEMDRERLVLALENQRSRLAAVIEQAPAFICTLRGPEHIFELANDRYIDFVGRRDVIGKTVREALPEIEGQGFFELLDDVYRTGKTFTGVELPALIGRAGSDTLDERFVTLVYQALRDADGNISGIFVHGFDVTDAVLAREAVRQSEARFRQLADAMPQIVWASRPDGVLDYYNRRWFEFIGLPNATSEELRWDQYVHPDDLLPAYNAWEAARGSETDYVLEFRVRRADGAYRWFLVRAVPIRDGDGAVFRWFGTCTDIQEQKELQAQKESLLESERAARSEAERASSMKDEFLATLSHEIRTPLNAILGWSQIMRRSKNPGDRDQGLDVIERNARAQSQIIEDLLDMSRIVSGKVRLDVQRVDLAAIVQSSVEGARPAAEAKGVRLLSVIDPLQGVVVSGDSSRLQQVLWNLLSNAIKFTPKGGRVQVLLERINSHLEVSVIDSGEGIKPEFLPYVFDRFRQADASTTRRHGGLGLGLSIVRQLVEMHGGTVRVHSAGPDLGTKFVVMLPLTVAHPEPIPPQERRHPKAAPDAPKWSSSCTQLDGVRALVVDDEPDARALLERLLIDCDAVVTTAASVAEAIEMLERDSFDVLVSDIGMPKQDGYALIAHLRGLAKERNGAIPAIALTAYARAEDRVRAITAGFTMHIAKPVEPIEFITMVAAASGRTGRLSS